MLQPLPSAIAPALPPALAPATASDRARSDAPRDFAKALDRARTPSSRAPSAEPSRPPATEHAHDDPNERHDQLANAHATDASAAARQKARAAKPAARSAGDHARSRGTDPSAAPAATQPGKDSDALRLPPEAETEDAAVPAEGQAVHPLLSHLQRSAVIAGRGIGVADAGTGDAEPALRARPGGPTGATAGLTDAAGAQSTAGAATGRGKLAPGAPDLDPAAAETAAKALQAANAMRATKAIEDGWTGMSSPPALASDLGSAAAASAANNNLPGGLTPLPGTPVTPLASTGPGVSVPGSAHLGAPLGSADFAPQLAAQLTTFVRDGIEHAQLHLNPADMGPVSVQIQLDGLQAQVHLSAEQAQTRQALDQALPQLASQLREAGLTLTGGGVFEQPRQGRTPQDGDPGSPQGRDGRRGTEAVQAAEARDRRPARRGVVDLVA